MYGSTPPELMHEMAISTASRAGRFSVRNSPHYWIGYCIGPTAGVVTWQKKTIFAPTGNHIPILRSPNPARRNRQSLSPESHRTRNLHCLRKT
jgi:hypothetical protein